MTWHSCSEVRKLKRFHTSIHPTWILTALSCYRPSPTQTLLLMTTLSYLHDKTYIYVPHVIDAVYLYLCHFVLLQMSSTEWKVSPNLYSYYLMVGYFFCLDVDSFIISSIILQINLKKTCYYVKLNLPRFRKYFLPSCRNTCCTISTLSFTNLMTSSSQD